MKNLPEQHRDASARIRASRDDRTHRLNLHVDPGTGKRSDFDPGGPEVPSKVERERINPADAAKQRRTPLIGVTPIVSPSGHSHIFEPLPSKL